MIGQKELIKSVRPGQVDRHIGIGKIGGIHVGVEHPRCFLPIHFEGMRVNRLVIRVCQLAGDDFGNLAISDWETGDVDVVLVHARKLEDKFVADGYGLNRRDVMYNDFVIIGPASDPAHVKGTKTSAEAFKRIADSKSTFISRGDESGTHQKEKEIWAEAGVTPQGNWYRSAGQGMGEVITMATEQRAYTLSDRGTYNAFRHGKTDLAVVFEGEKGLFNPYGVIAVNPKKFPHAKYDLAMKFVDFITGPEGQKIIANYKVEGDPIFFVYK